MSSESKNRTVVFDTEYKGCHIVVQITDSTEAVVIDNTDVQVLRDADTGSYSTTERAYETFGSAEELARAIVDARQDED